MTTTLWWLLQNTITIAILAAVVAVACRLLRTRPALQHALWLVVLIKFITPPVVIWPWSVRSLAESLSPNLGTAEAPAQDDPDPGRNMSAARTSVNTEFLDDLELRSNTLPDVFSDGGPMDTGEAEMPGALSAPIDAMSSEKPSQDAKTDEWLGTSHGGSSISEIGAMSSEGSSGTPGSTSDTHAIAAAATIVEQVPLDRLATIAFIAWLTGGLTLAMSQSRRIARHWSLVRRASAAPAHLTDEVRRVARAMQLRPISALVVRGIASPFVWCVGRLRLLWPEQLAGEADVARCRAVIAHELAHVRRRDHWIAWLELLASVVWWWNPLFWYVRRRLRETAEIACDAVALSVLPDSRREYAEAFLELSSMGKTVAPMPVLGVSTGAGRTFERRFAMMLSEHVRPKTSLWGLVAVGLLALITLPSWSLGQAPSPDGPGSASASSDTTAGPATQAAASATEPQLPEPPAARSAEHDDRGTVAPTKPRLPATAAQGGDSLESRVQKLEEKLDAILLELQKMRASSGPTLRGSVGAGSKSPPQQPGGSLGAGGASAVDVRAESPDGKVTAVTDDGKVFLAGRATRGLVRLIDLGKTEKVTSLKFSPDGKLLTVQTANKEIELDAATGKVLRTVDVVRPSSAGAPSASNAPAAGPVTGTVVSVDDSGSMFPVSTPELYVFPLEHTDARQLQDMFHQLGLLPNVKISADPRTNSILAAGPKEQVFPIEALILRLDVPADPASTTSPILEDVYVRTRPNATTVPAHSGKTVAQRVESGTQLDLVTLGTATIEARGALRLAQAQHDRMKKLAPAAAVSQEEVETAEIKLHTAQEKMELLTSIAQSAIDATQAEISAASADAKRSRQLYEKGFMPQSQVEQSEAQGAAAAAKLKLLDSILNPTTPPASDRKANLQ